MPFQSEKQRRFLWAKHPDIARRWSREYGPGVERLKARRTEKREPPKAKAKR